MSVVITFDALIGSVSETSRTYTTGSTFGELPTPTLGPYHSAAFYFVGWYLKGDQNMTRIEPSTVVPTSNSTLEAFYGEKTICITFDSNGGFVFPDSQHSLIYESGKTYKEQYTTTQTSVTTQWGLPPKQMRAIAGGVLTSEINTQWGGLDGRSWGSISGTDYGDEHHSYWGGDSNFLYRYIATICFVGWATQPREGMPGYRIIDKNSVLDLYRSCTLYAQWDFSRIRSEINFVDPVSGFSEIRGYDLYYGRTFGSFPVVPNVTGKVFLGWFTLPQGKTVKQYVDELTGVDNTLTPRELEYPVGGVRVDKDESYSYDDLGADLCLRILSGARGTVALVYEMGWQTCFNIRHLTNNRKYVTLFAHFSSGPIYVELVNSFGSYYAQGTYVNVIPYSEIPTVTPPPGISEIDYAFDGYYEEQNGAGIKYVNADGHSTGAKWNSETGGTLYANYVPVLYNVVMHDYNPDTGAPYPITKSETSDMKYPYLQDAVAMSRHPEYSFKHWALYYFGSLYAVHTGDSFYEQENLDLFPVWDFSFNNVSFVLNGGTFSRGTYPITASRKYYMWMRSENAKNYYPVGREETSHTGYWSTNGGQYEPAVSLYEPGQTGSFTRSGYSFGGWYSDPGFSTKVDTLVGVYAVDITLFAKWIPNNIQITFKYLDGTTDDVVVSASVGEEVGVIPQPVTRNGYIFAGWWTSSSGGTQINESYKFSSASTVYAHWKDANRIGLWSATIG